MIAITTSSSMSVKPDRREETQRGTAEGSAHGSNLSRRVKRKRCGGGGWLGDPGCRLATSADNQVGGKA